MFFIFYSSWQPAQTLNYVLIEILSLLPYTCFRNHSTCCGCFSGMVTSSAFGEDASTLWLSQYSLFPSRKDEPWSLSGVLPLHGDPCVLLVLTVISRWLSTLMAELEYLGKRSTFIFGKDIQTFDENAIFLCVAVTFLLSLEKLIWGKLYKYME